MTEQPSGTVTFLFTDIEGSTQLLERLGDRWAGALEEHRRLLRAAFAETGGYEVDSQGDAFFVAFARATDAARAAVTGQRALLSHGWPDGAELRVRMGLHTGEPIATGGSYVGLDVHRAARVAGVAHGAQILCTQPTRDLLDGLPVVDLGDHRLKDLAAPQRLYQLCAEGLPQVFPPLRTLGSRPTNLPLQPTALVGRTRELDELCSLVRATDTRLVTLTGPGGTGKTRLALQVAAELADDFADGTFFVRLAPIDDPELVPVEIAQAIGVNLGAGQTTAGFLAGKELLLLLDNLEQLLPATPGIAELLASAAGLRVMATSREPLRISGEQLYPVPPLRDEEAVELFTERARAADPSFELTDRNAADVAAVCRRLDDLPLALELAAARVTVLSPEAMLSRIAELGSGGARDLPERQRTMQATIDWSYRLLELRDRELFAKLGVFVGGFTLESAEVVCGATFAEIASLADKNLLRRSCDRFWMFETIRAFALDRLGESEEEDLLRVRHAEHFLALAEGAYAEQLHDASGNRLAADIDNLREALASFRESDHGRYLQLASALGWFWHKRSYFAEGLEHLDRALEGSPTRDALVARARAAQGAIRATQGDLAGFDALAQSLEIWRELDDGRGLSAALDDLGWAHFWNSANDEAGAAFEESLVLRRALGDDLAINRALVGVCQILVAHGDVDEAEAMAEELLERTAASGDAFAEHLAFHYLGDCALIRGEPAAAEAWYERSLSAAWAVGDRVESALELHGLAMSAAGRGRGDEALRFAGAADAALLAASVDVSGIEFWVALLDRYLGADRALSDAYREGLSWPLDRAVAAALGT